MLTDDGAIISEKLAKLYGLESGDKLTVVDKDNETFEIEVAAITENYVMHYVYMTPKILCFCVRRKTAIQHRTAELHRTR